MVPLASVVTVREDDRSGHAVAIQTFIPSAVINANDGPGTSSGQAIERMQEISKKGAVQGMRTEWTELALLQRSGRKHGHVRVLSWR